MSQTSRPWLTPTASVVTHPSFQCCRVARKSSGSIFTQGWKTKNREPMQADFAEPLLERGATPNARASLRDV